MVPDSGWSDLPGIFVKIFFNGLRFLGPNLKPAASKFPGVKPGNLLFCQIFPGDSDQPGLKTIAGKLGKDAETQPFLFK